MSKQKSALAQLPSSPSQQGDQTAELVPCTAAPLLGQLPCCRPQQIQQRPPGSSGAGQAGARMRRRMWRPAPGGRRQALPRRAVALASSTAWAPACREANEGGLLPSLGPSPLQRQLKCQHAHSQKKQPAHLQQESRFLDEQLCLLSVAALQRIGGPAVWPVVTVSGMPARGPSASPNASQAHGHPLVCTCQTGMIPPATRLGSATQDAGKCPSPVTGQVGQAHVSAVKQQACAVAGQPAPFLASTHLLQEVRCLVRCVCIIYLNGR